MQLALTTITLDFQAATARIRLANPPVNVISVAMMDELKSALDAIELRHDISTIVFSGQGKGFSAGVDIAAHTPDKIQDMLARFHAVLRALAATQKITIAAVEGNCLGGGAEIALLCDMAFAAKNASFAFPEIQLACFPPVAAVALSAVVGQKRAAELVLTGRALTADEAAACGLINEAVPTDQLESKVDETLNRLAKLSPAALALAKKAFYAWDAIHLDKGLARAEKIYLEELIKTHDCNEGVAAWMEKRAPRWTGK